MDLGIAITMFTGIISTTGSVTAATVSNGDMVLNISAPGMDFRHTRIGDSIAVAGVCLTVIALQDNEFAADVSAETLALTTLSSLAPGDLVNLEAALRLGEALGGHMVSGHVDERGMLVSRSKDARSERFEFEVSGKLSRFVAQKGSVCIDGVSLTVNDVAQRRFGVNLIPHSMVVTTLGQLKPGDWVNIEIDMLARYVERLVSTSNE